MKKYLLFMIFIFCMMSMKAQTAKQLQMRQQAIPASLEIYHHGEGLDTPIRSNERLGTYDIQSLNAVYCDSIPEPFFGTHIEHTIFPWYQVRPLKFFMDLHNNGSLTCTDAKMKVKVLNSNSILFYEDSTLGDTLQFSDLKDSLSWSDLSMPNNYTVHFIADHDSINLDSVMTNNESVLNLQVIAPFHTIFGRDRNNFTTSGIWNGNGNGYIIGSEFVSVSNSLLYGVKVAFAQGTDPGAVGCVMIYEMDPGATSISDLFIPVLDDCSAGLNFTLGPLDISTSNLNWVYISLSNPLIMEQDKIYFVGINYYGSTNNMMIMSGGPVIEGGITNWIYDQNSSVWYYMSEIPMIRLYFDPEGVGELSSISNLNLVPNPANNTTTVQFSFNERMDVALNVSDLSGKTILQKNCGILSAGENTISLDVSELNSGIYFCTLQTSTGSSTQKLVIEK